ncbi:MAG: hypothetical protein QF440_01335 [Candidatus Thalassarchaeaceae archaeon]|jgi:nucleolar protein 56|nr:hypothetical protein [Candidatus Thalassarchaeaceae archaeon]
MQLVWDWRLARIFDEEGRCIDESIWTTQRTVGVTTDRLSTIAKGRMTSEALELSNRFPEATYCTPSECDFYWPELSDEELILLQNASISLAKLGVAAAAHDPDRRLEHLVRAMDEMRASHNTLESRIVEWVGLFLSSLDLDKRRSEIVKATTSSQSLDDLAIILDVTPTNAEVGLSEWEGVHGWAVSTLSQADCLNNLEEAVRELATEHLPSLSLLLGPILAAQLCVTAHGRARLARFPAGTIQVLGAEKAFFSHLRQGTNPPKHGHIFQHPWICRSPRWVRGKISRMLASKAAIAARVDHFGGETWGSKQVGKIENLVYEIRERYPNPTSRWR